MIHIVFNPRVPSSRARLDAVLDKLSPGPWVVQIAPHGQPSRQQMRYYRSRLTAYCEATGEDPGEAHERLVTMAVAPEAFESNGLVKFTTPSSANLSPEVFSRLIETLHREAAEAGVVL